MKGILQVREGDREKLLFFLWVLPVLHESREQPQPENATSLRMKPIPKAAEQRWKEPGSSLSDGALRNLGL